MTDFVPTCPNCNAALRIEHNLMCRLHGRVACTSCLWRDSWVPFQVLEPLGEEPRFWERVDQSGDCWLWMGGSDGRGYGSVFFHGRIWSTHRLAYVLTFGPIPDGLWVLHKCDNRPCVRPDHLFLGTPLDNVQDAIQKGRFEPVIDAARPFRFAPGRIPPNTKMIPEVAAKVVTEFQSGGVTRAGLARKFGVARSTINEVIRKGAGT